MRRVSIARQHALLPSLKHAVLAPHEIVVKSKHKLGAGFKRVRDRCQSQDFNG